MTPQQAIELLLSEPVIAIDDDGVSMNVEDDTPGAMVVLEVARRNELVCLLKTFLD